MRLEGKSALISGGSRGIGAAIAQLISEHGAQVVLGDLLEEEGKAVEYEIQKSGAKASFVKLDVSSETSWQYAIDTGLRALQARCP